MANTVAGQDANKMWKVVKKAAPTTWNISRDRGTL